MDRSSCQQMLKDIKSLQLKETSKYLSAVSALDQQYQDHIKQLLQNRQLLRMKLLQDFKQMMAELTVRERQVSRWLGREMPDMPSFSEQLAARRIQRMSRRHARHARHARGNARNARHARIWPQTQRRHASRQMGVFALECDTCGELLDSIKSASQHTCQPRGKPSRPKQSHLNQQRMGSMARNATRTRRELMSRIRSGSTARQAVWDSHACGSREGSAGSAAAVGPDGVENASISNSPVSVSLSLSPSASCVPFGLQQENVAHTQKPVQTSQALQTMQTPSVAPSVPTSVASVPTSVSEDVSKLCKLSKISVPKVAMKASRGPKVIHVQKVDRTRSKTNSTQIGAQKCLQNTANTASTDIDDNFQNFENCDDNCGNCGACEDEPDMSDTCEMQNSPESKEMEFDVEHANNNFMESRGMSALSALSALLPRKGSHTNVTNANIDVRDVYAQLQGLQGTSANVFNAPKPKCTVCNFTCGDEKSLAQHMRLHAEEKPYACLLCKHRCESSQNLVRHMATHSGPVKPFECSVCNQKFKLKSYLKKHMKIHQHEKPFQCQSCLARFSTYHGWSHHVNTICVQKQ